MKKNLLHALLALVLLLGLCGPAHATTPPPAAGRSLAEALNPDGTLKAGLNGSFDARAFRMGTAPDGRPVFRPAGVAGAGDERWQSGFGLPDGADDDVHVVVRSGSDIYIGGSFTVVGNVPANGVAKWNGTAWSALGTGVAFMQTNGLVYALAVAGNGDVYVGGNFNKAGGGGANFVAKWKGSVWSPLGPGAANGVDGTVYALAVGGNGDVYVGGQFNKAGGATANYLARWNGTTWSQLGTSTFNDFNSGVRALAIASNGDLYAAGGFTRAGGIAANRVARWDGTAWNALGTGAANGLDAGVYALAIAGNGDVYVGGQFTQASGMAASNVARWNGTAWSSLGTGTANGVGNYICALAVAGNGDVYVGGYFMQAGGVAAGKVARWNGTAWNTLATGATNGVTGTYSGISDYVYGLAVAGNGDVYMGGRFDQVGSMAASNVTRWNGSAWNILSSGTTNGVAGIISALAVAPNGDVYVGGQFTKAGSVVASNVARWNGTAWSSLGTGTANGVDNSVLALAVAGNGDVYVGGYFTQAGGVAAGNVARWNGTAWSPLGAGTANGNGASGSTVSALAVAPNGDVYVGGQFTQAGGVAANAVARWDGTAWSPLGTGTSVVNALAVASNGDVYAGGYFTMVGGVAANRVARWNGTTWSSLGTGAANGVSSVVNALAVAPNGDVYVGGVFAQAGGVAANYVARWNGTTWNSLGTGTTNGSGGAFAVASNGDVYVGGGFILAGGVAANRVARWDGTTWSPLGSGVNSGVNALAIGSNGKLYVGGTFTAVSDGGTAMVSFGIYDPNAPLATTAAVRATPAAQLYPNPAHGTATLRLPAGAARQPLVLTDALGRTVR
ncbi:MAG: hypothetical protein JWP58_692, partial [Hymenobacter sp.]|nr:hypothetical protein [Hymenobacter sp.]